MLMKRYSLIIIAIVTLLGFMVLPTFAAEKMTITGMGTCAKCALKESDTCQTVIQVQQDGKTVNYYVVDNKKAKDFHENVCKEPHKVIATGKVYEKDGKEMIKVSKIEMAP